MSSKYTEYHVQLIDNRTGKTIDDDTGLFTVMTVSVPALATIYSDKNGTTTSGVQTMTNGEMSFWTDNTVSSVDVTGMTASGIPFFIDALTPSQHRLEIDVNKYSGLMLVLPFDINASTSLFDTGYDLAATHIVKDVKVRVTTVGGAGASSVTANILQVGNSTLTSVLIGTCQISTTGWYQHAPGLDLSAQPAATGSVPMLVGSGLMASTTNLYVRKSYIPGVVTSIIYKDHSVTGIKGSGYIYIEMDRAVVA